MFQKLAPGKYDLVILTKDRLRLEGWQYSPVKEFDPVFAPTATTDDDTRRAITEDIAKSEHYENKVVPLAMGGDNDAVRVLVMLIRDKQTTLRRNARRGDDAARDLAIFVDLWRMAEGAAHPRV